MKENRGTLLLSRELKLLIIFSESNIIVKYNLSKCLISLKHKLCFYPIKKQIQISCSRNKIPLYK